MIKNLLVRETRFLRRPLSLTSRVLLLAAAAALVAAIFLPLWKIHLVAPQYREGLALHIYAHKLVGGNGGQDLHEINTLNHYIGMKPIAQADFVEMTWLPFALGAFALLALRAMFIGRMQSLVDLVVLFVYFTTFSLINFYTRLYNYGHELDPRAPMTIEPFMPVMIGSQKIANFIQSSLPQSGALCLGLVPLLIILAMWLSRNESLPEQ